MKVSNYLKLSRHAIYVFRRRVPKALISCFKTSEVIITTHTRDKFYAYQVARRLASDSDNFFKTLLLNTNMQDENERRHLIQLTQNWVEKNRLRTRLDELDELHFAESIKNKQLIKDLKQSQTQALESQQASYEHTLDFAKGLIPSIKLASSGAVDSPKNIEEMAGEFFLNLKIV